MPLIYLAGASRKAAVRAFAWRSRRYRLGVAPHILSLPDGEAPPPRPPLRFCGWRPFALPYWVAWSFLLGSINFIIGSFCWMVPGVGDSEHGAPAWEVLCPATYPNPYPYPNPHPNPNRNPNPRCSTR